MSVCVRAKSSTTGSISVLSYDVVFTLQLLLIVRFPATFTCGASPFEPKQTHHQESHTRIPGLCTANRSIILPVCVCTVYTILGRNQ